MCFLFLLFYCSRDHRDLHSFPTRRSSDLAASMERHPPYNVPSAFPLTIGSMPEPGTAAISHCALPSSADFQLGTCSRDRKSTRLNSSHANISYAVFCLKKKNKINLNTL